MQAVSFKFRCNLHLNGGAGFFLFGFISVQNVDVSSSKVLFCIVLFLLLFRHMIRSVSALETDEG